MDNPFFVDAIEGNTRGNVFGFGGDFKCRGILVDKFVD